MKLLIILLSLAIWQSSCLNTQAQEEQVLIEEQKKQLQEAKGAIYEEERNALKTTVKVIQKRFDAGEITNEKAETLKKEAAEKHALNIENRQTIIDMKIALLERNGVITEPPEKDSRYPVTIQIETGEKKHTVLKIGEKETVKRDRRTTNDLVLAFGLNNALIEGESLDDSLYKIKGSRFVEIGTAWKTRVLNNSNFVRIKYGASIQINGLIPIDNQYFVQDGDKTYLKPFQYDSKKIKLSVYNLVFPVHIELGPSKRIEKKEHIRYSTRNKFKIGIGGYAGFNIGTRQKLKYTQDGSRKKDKIKQSYNVSELVYGWSSYVAFDRLALYMKYDLSPLFKSPNKEQHNVSLGLRFDVD